MTGRRTSMQPYHILAGPDEWTAPYWAAARRGKLALPRCQDCGFWMHPARFFCIRCKAAEPNLAYAELSGQGTLYSFVLHYETRISGFDDKVPFIAAVIELDEQPGLTVWGNVLNADYEQLTLGLPVKALWEDTPDPDIKMMQWQPTAVGTGGNR